MGGGGPCACLKALRCACTCLWSRGRGGKCRGREKERGERGLPMKCGRSGAAPRPMAVPSACLVGRGEGTGVGSGRQADHDRVEGQNDSDCATRNHFNGRNQLAHTHQ
eukprot:220737-Chlamydomonas_euryale.AAC.3